MVSVVLVLIEYELPIAHATGKHLLCKVLFLGNKQEGLSSNREVYLQVNSKELLQFLTGQFASQHVSSLHGTSKTIHS